MVKIVDNFDAEYEVQCFNCNIFRREVKIWARILYLYSNDRATFLSVPPPMEGTHVQYLSWLGFVSHSYFMTWYYNLCFLYFSTSQMREAFSHLKQT